MRKLLVGFLFIIGSFNLASAQGIPVYDNAQTLSQQQNFVKQIAEMAEQLKMAENQLNEFKSEAMNMQRRLEGFSGFANNFSKDDLMKTLDSLIQSVDTQTINEYLKRNNLENIDDERLRKSFEREAVTFERYDQLVKQLGEKDKELLRLQNQFNQAQTPQQREELSNAIAVEKTKMDNINKTAEYELKKAEIENQTQERAEYNDYINSKFGGY